MSVPMVRNAREQRILRPGRGLKFFDDFSYGATGSGSMGETRWFSAAVGGGAATAASGMTLSAADRAALVMGAMLIGSQAANGQGTAFSTAATNMSIPFLYGSVYKRRGSYLQIRLRNNNSLVDCEHWCGLVHDNDVSPLTAADVRGVFFRRVGDGVGAGRWTGVVKSGAGAGNETTVTLTTAAEDLVTWYTFMAYYTGTGVQFYRATGVGGLAPVGSEVTANLPADGLLMAPTLGALTNDAGNAIRSWAIDWIDLEVPARRLL